MSSKSRDERRLGWWLCAPAVLAMLAVTAYPIIYAIVLSVQEFDLRFPEDKGFAGLDNYATVLTDPRLFNLSPRRITVSTIGLGRRIIACRSAPAGTIGYTESSCSTWKSTTTPPL